MDEDTQRPARRWIAWLVRGLVVLALVGVTLWSALAIRYSNLPEPLRLPGALAYVAGAVALVVFVRPRRRGVLCAFAAWGLVVLGWLTIPPSNDRNWRADVALPATATFEGDRVTIRNVRDFDYRSETDYTVRYYDKTCDLARLRTADFYVVHWGSPSIAHTMMSFGFDDGTYVCFSIETRPEVGEAYSAIKGFFKQYELFYVVGDERDLVRLRTNFRHEDVYLYRLRASPELARKVFVDYVREVDRLAHHPQWYNALTDNCTTNIRGHTAPYNPDAKWDWRILINGYVDEMAYENGALDTSLSFEELKRRSHVNAVAQSLPPDADFSAGLRRGLPGTAR